MIVIEKNRTTSEMYLRGCFQISLVIFQFVIGNLNSINTKKNASYRVATKLKIIKNKMFSFTIK